MARQEESRKNESRELEARIYTEDQGFEEPDLLHIPQEVKDRFLDQGLVLRWIRVTVQGRDDIQNVNKRGQDGWSFVDPKEVPELVFSSTVKDEGRYAGAICRGDLALAKASKARMEARQAFYERRSAEMMDSVNAQLGKLQDRRAPISNSSKSTVTKGRQPQFQD